MGSATTPWRTDGGNASIFSRQTVPFFFPVASAAVFDPRDHGNASQTCPGISPPGFSTYTVACGSQGLLADAIRLSALTEFRRQNAEGRRANRLSSNVRPLGALRSNRAGERVENVGEDLR